MNHEDPDIAEENVDVIRRRLASRIDSLSHQLSPDAVVAKVVGTSEPNARELLESALRFARDNPISTLLMGAGLLTLGASRHGLPDRAVGAARTRFDLANESSRHHQERLRARTEHLRHQADEWQRRVGESAARVQHSIESSTEQLSRQARMARARARAAAQRTRDMPKLARARTHDLTDWARRNPVAIALATMAVGAAVASVVTAKPARGARADRAEPRSRIVPASRAPAQPRYAPGSGPSIVRADEPQRQSAYPRSGLIVPNGSVGTDVAH